MAKRQLAGGIILCLALAASLGAETPAAVMLGTPPQPGWAQLNPQQRNILSPLAVDWDRMENIRRKKWLGIAERYPNMKLDEQHRVQQRMREWANLTPEQRAKARDAYKDFNQLPADQKQVLKQKWEAYSSLPTEEKQRLRSSGKSSKLLNPSASEATSSGLPQSGENTASPSPFEGNTSEAGKR